MLRLPCLLTAIVLALPLPALATNANDGYRVEQFRLDNGMKVLVREDHRAPVVVSQIWYRVGSVDEHRGVTGVSHVLEHMMFQGTDRLKPGEFSEVIARHGGRSNAFTSRDYTAYYQEISAGDLALCLELEADRMTGLTLAPEQFERELRVVREERRQRVEDEPRALTYERLRAAAYPSSPTRNPVIGWKADLEHLTVADVADWYQWWYAPNDAALVVVGDVDPQHVLALARKYFGGKKSRELPARPAGSEVEPRGELRVKVHAPATLPYLALAWRVPSLATAEDPREVYALDVLSGLLDGGRSARIERNVVRGSGIAASAGASYSPLSRTDELFSAGGTPAEGRTVAELERALRAQVAALREGRVTPDELARVKTNLRARDVFRRDSMFYQAMRIGVLESDGLGQEAYASYREGVQAVTAADVRRVARKYLVDRRLTVAQLVPDGVRAGDGASRGSQESIGGQSDVVR